MQQARFSHELPPRWNVALKQAADVLQTLFEYAIWKPDQSAPILLIGDREAEADSTRCPFSVGDQNKNLSFVIGGTGRWCPWVHNPIASEDKVAVLLRP